MTDNSIHEVTPDRLMQRFQGSGLKKIVIFTLVAHVVVIGGSSVPYLLRSLFRRSASAMTQEERIKAAVKEATEAIRNIAADYQLNPQEISDQFSRGGSRAAVVAPAEAEPAESDAAAQPERPTSEIERAMDVKAEGPEVPTIDDGIF